jgi:hypothetical protein
LNRERVEQEPVSAALIDDPFDSLPFFHGGRPGMAALAQNAACFRMESKLLSKQIQAAFASNVSSIFLLIKEE